MVEKLFIIIIWNYTKRVEEEKEKIVHCIEDHGSLAAASVSSQSFAYSLRMQKKYCSLVCLCLCEYRVRIGSKREINPPIYIYILSEPQNPTGFALGLTIALINSDGSKYSYYP